MNAFETQNDDVIDLGAVQEETRGSSPVGLDDSQPGLKFIAGGIDRED
jgi:hypothetical protein